MALTWSLLGSEMTKLKDLNLSDIRPGLRIKINDGRMATVAAADSRPEHLKRYGPSSNGATYDNDDHWLFVDIDDDEYRGHGVYAHLSEQEVVLEKKATTHYSVDAQESYCGISVHDPDYGIFVDDWGYVNCDECFDRISNERRQQWREKKKNESEK